MTGGTAGSTTLLATIVSTDPIRFEFTFDESAYLRYERFARGGKEVDDGIALVQAFHSPELAIRGVSVVFGNAPLTEAWPIAQSLIAQYAPQGTPLHKGAAKAGEAAETPATKALAKALQKEKLTLIVLGPATNIAAVLRLHPELKPQITQIIAVAGRRPNQLFQMPQQPKPFRDLNFELDPAAFQTILDSKIPLTLAPWEISSKVWIEPADLAAYAKSAGLGDIKVTWAIISGPVAVNDALLSGSIDIAAGGVPGMLTLWARTKGTPLAVKGISAFTSQPILLNSRNPNVKTIADFTADDKIAMPSIKTSIQAIILQMAAAKLWGKSEYAKLDNLTVPMTPPDSTVAIMSGAAAGISSVFSVPPYQTQQLEKPEVHTVLNSYDVFGGPHTLTVGWTTSKWHDENPKLYQAVFDALAEATERVNKDPKLASQYWIEGNKSNIPLDKVVGIATEPQTKWTMVPENTFKFAEFMHSVGSIKMLPADWKDLFFPEAHQLPGS